MTIREFTDSHGLLWRVWSTVPTNVTSVDPDLRGGWLSFDSGLDRRRVCPIPKGWDQLPPERLELLCRVAAMNCKSDPKGVTILKDEDAG